MLYQQVCEAIAGAYYSIRKAVVFPKKTPSPFVNHNVLPISKINEWYPWGLQIGLHIRSPGFSKMEGGGYFRVNFGHLKSEVFENGGGYFRVNFGHLKSEVFQNGGDISE